MENKKGENKKINSDKFKTGYIDESGDPGKNGSKCSVLTYISLNEGKKITKILNKTKELLRRTKKGERWLNKNGGELKFYSFPDKRILLKTIEELSKLKIQIRFITIYKNNKDIASEIKLQIVSDLINDVFNLEDMPHKIIADKDYFNNKKITHLIIQDYETKIYDDEIKGYKYRFYFAEDQNIAKSDKVKMAISIKHENSKNNLGLQVADLISGAIFQEMEKGNKEYTDLIRTNTQIQGRIMELK